MTLAVDSRVSTAAVTASGRVLVSPDWFGALALDDAAFVLAHELLHLALETHSRGAGYPSRAVNVAHDCIINDLLVDRLGRHAPGGGLWFRGARACALEPLVRELALDPPDEGAFGADDVLSRERERELFPDDDEAEVRSRVARVRSAGAEALVFDGLEAAAGLAGGRIRHRVEARRGARYASWPEVLQRWLEDAAPPARTFVRPSRRATAQAGVVLPGRRREGWTVNVALDTSGSMKTWFGPFLRALGRFCVASNVAAVRLVQCDAAITQDDVVGVDELSDFTVEGLGGSDLTPAIERLAGDPSVRSALVLTDGQVHYPARPPGISVLWVVPEEAGFAPDWGRVLELPRELR